MTRVKKKFFIYFLILAAFSPVVFASAGLGAEYCASNGNSIYYEWIKGVAIGDFSNISDKNNGYADFTAEVIDLAAGSHQVSLTPGFGSGTYTESWKIWIDFNHDFTFTTNEVVYSGSSPSTIVGNITVPDSALSGDTRMRISMRYGAAPPACGSFSYGEVEDYTVRIEGMIDTTPPDITGVTPVVGTIDVPVDGVISATFSEPLDPATVTTATFFVSDGASQIAGVVSYSGPTATLTPRDNLEYETTYTATITTGIQDLAGNKLQSDYTWSFTTAPEPLPEYCASNGNNVGFEWVEGVAIGEFSHITGKNNGYGDFTAQIIDLTTGSHPISLKPGFGSGTYTESWKVWIDFNQDFAFTTDEVVYSGSSSSIMVGNITIPTSALSGDTRMRISMRYGAAPPACGSFTYGEVEDYTVRIEGTIDTTSPEITGVTPGVGTIDVPVDGVISATFSEPLDPATVTTATFFISDGVSQIEGVVSYSGLTATWIPTSNLDHGKAYTATITTEVQDLSGNKLQSDFVWTFTTVVQPLLTYALSGQITQNGSGVDGVTVTLTGDISKNTMTQSGGQYAFGALPPGNYTVTPSLAGLSFNPSSVAVTIEVNDVDNIHFEAFPGSYIFVPGNYPSIQAAIDAAPEGATILVADGTYTENVDVDKQLTILSQNGYGSTTVVAADEYDHVFHVTADFVTIEGFTIYGATDMHKAGIYLGDGVSHCTIKNNRSGYGYFTRNYHGIFLDNASNNIIAGNTCSQNANGIWLSLASKNNVIEDNVFDWNDTYGINLYPSGDSSPSENILAKNQCSSNRYGIHLHYSNSNILTGNTCNSNEYQGIWLESSNDNTLSGNASNFNGDYGIWLEYSNENTLRGNTCNSNDNYGLFLMASKENNTMYLNNFSNNSFGNVYSSVFSGTTNNQWHSPTKMNYYYNGTMYHGYMGNYYQDHSLVDSDGDGITDNAYDLPNTEPYDEFPLVQNSGNYFGQMLRVPENYPSIQAAINMAFPGDTILVADGTYVENVIIGKPVTIRSENGYRTTTVIAENSGDHVFSTGLEHVTIEGFTIYGAFGLEEAGIFLGQYSKHCVISNNRLGYDPSHTNYYGISLLESSNNIIAGNICTANHETGIYLKQSYDNLLTGNTSNSNNNRGIYLDRGKTDSVHNIISGNTCLDNVIGIEAYANSNTISENNCSNNEYGIQLTVSSFSSVAENICTFNSSVGVYLYQSSGSNLEGNICENNWDGIHLRYSGGNKLLNNECNSNNSNGISLYSSSGNTLSGNDCSLNTYGLSLTNYSDQNKIFMNNFSDNTGANVQSASYGIYINIWRSSSEMNYSYDGFMFTGYLGNYYGDHILVDTDGDGITDEPYDLPGDEPDDPFALVTTPDHYTVE